MPHALIAISAAATGSVLICDAYDMRKICNICEKRDIHDMCGSMQASGLLLAHPLALGIIPARPLGMIHDLRMPPTPSLAGGMITIITSNHHKYTLI